MDIFIAWGVAMVMTINKRISVTWVLFLCLFQVTLQTAENQQPIKQCHGILKKEDGRSRKSTRVQFQDINNGGLVITLYCDNVDSNSDSDSDLLDQRMYNLSPDDLDDNPLARSIHPYAEHDDINHEVPYLPDHPESAVAFNDLNRVVASCLVARPMRPLEQYGYGWKSNPYNTYQRQRQMVRPTLFNDISDTQHQDEEVKKEELEIRQQWITLNKIRRSIGICYDPYLGKLVPTSNPELCMWIDRNSHRIPVIKEWILKDATVDPDCYEFRDESKVWLYDLISYIATLYVVSDTWNDRLRHQGKTIKIVPIFNQDGGRFPYRWDRIWEDIRGRWWYMSEDFFNQHSHGLNVEAIKVLHQKRDDGNFSSPYQTERPHSIIRRYDEKEQL